MFAHINRTFNSMRLFWTGLSTCYNEMTLSITRYSKNGSDRH